MRLSARTQYACLAMLELAVRHDEGRPAPLRSLCDRQAIPEGFLVQILGDLRRAGLVASTRGAGGGYRLTLPPSEVSLAEVVDAIEGREPPCEPATGTALARALDSFCDNLRQRQREQLEAVTLADLAAEATPAAAPMWYI
ncbi:MAG: Rrf2 family transcriptional regulator [Planctomycetota bacterium]